ncbi:MAG TPA: GNAT family N-acetyltransferase [Dehalococcoidia bacterium]|nr:GNAT family N-acetyltransferase [Dehalococcoidia bacterium]
MSKATLCLDAGVAGIYGVVTRPEARGMGLARTLTLAALRAAKSAGYERAILHSSPMARSLYRGIGFTEYAPFKVFAPPRSFHL